MDTIGKGIILLTFYSLGLAIPFLLTALAIESLSPKIKQLGKHLRIISLVSGVLMIIKDNKYTFPILLDSDNEAAVNYRVVSIPTSFFIDKDRTIIDKHIGSMTIDDMKAYIKKIQ